MSDRPIIFASPMIRALLDGRKTMGRQMAWRDAEPNAGIPVPTIWQKVQPGDEIWVRETWQIPALCNIQYRATDTARIGHWNPELGPWKSPIHMPRWASRLTLVVTETKMERLQEISEVDAMAEGIAALNRRINTPKIANDCIVECVFPDGKIHYGDSAYRLFAGLWTSLHGPAAWDSNPEIVALRFTVHNRNIDAMEAA